MNRALKFLAACVVVLGVAGVTGAAWAYFTSTGGGTGAGTVGTLASPTNVLAPSPPAGATTVHVSWTPPTSPSGSLAGFFVERLAGTTPSAACGSSPSSLLGGTATSCDDTSVALGSYTYRVTVSWRSWTAVSAASTPATAVTAASDTTAPSVSVTFPANNGAYTTSSFNGGCSPTGICGIASDTGSGVASVSVSIKRLSDNTYWTGSGFTTSTSTFVPVTSGTTAWKYTFAAPAAGSYAVQARALDNASNLGASVANTFVIDNTAPTVTVNQAAGQVDPTNVLPINSTVSFSEPVTGFDASDLTRTGTATGGTVSISGGPSTYNIAVTGTPTNGSIGFTVAANKALDLAGNSNTASTSTDNTVTYDTVAPSASSLFDTNINDNDKLPKAGETVAFGFSEAMLPESILSGWTGSSTNVVVRFTDGGASANDTLTVFDSTNTTQTKLGSVDLGDKAYVATGAGTVTFGTSGSPSTMVMSGTTVTVTLGAKTGTINNSGNKPDARWTPNAGATDLAGNACTTTVLPETGSNDNDF